MLLVIKSDPFNTLKRIATRIKNKESFTKISFWAQISRPRINSTEIIMVAIPTRVKHVLINDLLSSSFAKNLMTELSKPNFEMFVTMPDAEIDDGNIDLPRPRP